ncbi:hypothetical protein RRG08_034410 [Elysia crispata]|uniref:Uncharacterized protein n=1 Tax=Elysia crispata TaxID=231223 RepID=A0AAE0YCZ7_9GAST|nr:hypothetical protein RRG08_034410 [Elysia crispata]
MLVCALLVALSFSFSAGQLPDLGAPDSNNQISEFTPDDSVARRTDTAPDNVDATPLVITTPPSTTPSTGQLITTPITTTAVPSTTTRKPQTNVFSNVQPRQFYYNYPNENFNHPFDFPIYNPNTNTWSNSQPQQPMQQPMQQTNYQYAGPNLPWWMLAEI